jgi:hypothetical protein
LRSLSCLAQAHGSPANAELLFEQTFGRALNKDVALRGLREKAIAPPAIMGTWGVIAPTLPLNDAFSAVAFAADPAVLDVSEEGTIDTDIDRIKRLAPTHRARESV